MKAIIYIITSLLTTLMALDCHSQQVKQDATTGIIYIDCSTMPYKSRRTTPVKEHFEKDADNRVPNRLAIAPSDANPTPLTAAAAQTICKNYVGPNGGEAGKWRLPNQREAIRINTFTTKLNKITGFVPFRGTESVEIKYWTSTKRTYDSYEDSGHYPAYWCINFTQFGLTSREKDTDYYYVRCVRDY